MQPQPQQINIDLNNATPMKCPCGGEHFTGGFKLFKVSALVSPTGQEIIVPMAVFLCHQCGEILK